LPHLRIGIVVPGFHAYEAEPFVPCWADLVRTLAATHEVWVFPLRRPAQSAEYRAFGARVIPGPLGNPRLRASPILWLEAVRRITAVAGAAGLDVIHALHANESGFVAALAAGRLRVPLVVHVGGGELVGLPEIGYGSRTVPMERFQVRVALGRADVITAGCGQTQRSLHRLGRSALWAPFGVDPERFCPTAAAPETPDTDQAPDRARRNVLCVADLNPVKGHLLLLDAFHRAKAQDPRLVLHLVGDGPELAKLRRRARELGVADHVRWWGRIPNVALPAIYRQSDAFALASHHEAQGVALLEAAASGLPIVSTAVGLAPELPAAGTRLVTRRDPQAFADAMRGALEAAERHGPSAALRQAVVGAHGLPAAAARMVEAYDQAIGPRRHPRAAA
jgi:glycosyltransferase involved in cell wall biosynthesis